MPQPEPVAERVHGAYVPAAPVEPKPELIPVPASVFDDDFFRKPQSESRRGEDRWDNGSRDIEAGSGVQQRGQATHWPEAKVPSFAGYAADSSPSSDEDELDIPAFLRRSR